jgi:hypothetical protein
MTDPPARFPPMNLAPTLSPVPGLDAEVVDQARERFYPDWWMFEHDGASPVEPRPSYRVVVRTEEERDLAYHVKPASVDAEIVLERS